MAHEPAPKLLFSMKEAAERLGVPLWKVRRAVKSGLLPTYTFYDTKKYLRLAEVEAVILRSREGGAGLARGARSSTACSTTASGCQENSDGFTG
jgi:excisionase family DNA binding protein